MLAKREGINGGVSYLDVAKAATLLVNLKLAVVLIFLFVILTEDLVAVAKPAVIKSVRFAVSETDSKNSAEKKPVGILKKGENFLIMPFSVVLDFTISLIYVCAFILMAMESLYSSSSV